MTTTKFYPSFSNKLQKAIYEKLQTESKEELVVGSNIQIEIFDRSKKLSTIVKQFISQKFSQYSNIEISSIVKETVINNLSLSNEGILNILDTRLNKLSKDDLKSGLRCIESNTEESRELRELFKNTVEQYSLNPLGASILKRRFEKNGYSIKDDIQKHIIECKTISNFVFELVGENIPKRTLDCLIFKSYEFSTISDFEIIKLLTLMIVYETTDEQFYTKFIKNFPNTFFRKQIKEIIIQNSLTRFDAKILNHYLYYCEKFDIEINNDVEHYIVEKSKHITKIIIKAINKKFNISFERYFYNNCSNQIKNLVYSKIFLDDKRLLKSVLKEVKFDNNILYV